MPERIIAAVSYVDAKVISEIQNNLNRYYNKNETDAKLNEKSNNEHTHTINEISDLLFRDNEVIVQMSGFYKKRETDDLLNNKMDKSGAYTKEEINAAIQNINEDISDRYTKNETDSLLENKMDKSGAYTKEEINAAIQNINEDISDRYTKEEIDAAIQSVNEDMSDRYTKEETDAKLDEKSDAEHTHTMESITDFPSVVSKTASGLCPTLPDESTTTKYLRQDGTWTVPSIDTTYGDFVQSGSTAAAGLVPKPDTTAGTRKYLREDATWAEPDTEYTFIIDSDAKLSDWADNTAGNDYSRILVKAGTWTLTSTLSGGSSSSPKIAIDISNGRTKSVVGESGSKIVINNSQSSTYLIGIKGKITGTYPNFSNSSKEYFFRNVNIKVNCTGNGYGFSSCTNLSNCTGDGNGMSGGYGFSSCTNLSNCTGTGNVGDVGDGYGFYNCTNLSNCTGTGYGDGNGGNGYGFSNCIKLSNCTGTGNAYGNGNGKGFYSCRTGFGNRGTYIGSAGIAGISYMDPGTGTSQVWASSAAGGWNNNAAP